MGKVAKIKHLLAIVMLLCGSAIVSGCATVTMTAATTGGVVLSQERSPGNAIDDFTIWSEISHLYLQEHIDDILARVDVKVIEGRVHLTGVVKEPSHRIDAVRLAWQPKGVKEVINEVEVSEKGRSIKEYARDQWIDAQIESKILLEKGVRSLNYSIEVVRGNVYVMGIAQDITELKKVTYLASHTLHVKKVTSHVRLKDDPERS